MERHSESDESYEKNAAEPASSVVAARAAAMLSTAISAALRPYSGPASWTAGPASAAAPALSSSEIASAESSGPCPWALRPPAAATDPLEVGRKWASSRRRAWSLSGRSRGCAQSKSWPKLSIMKSIKRHNSGSATHGNSIAIIAAVLV